MKARECEMNDNDINEKEVIDAMSYCFAVGDCERCAYRGKTCVNMLSCGVLIIKRLKAENKRLETELQAMRGAANSLKLNLQTARAEAIEEFAEILKQRQVDLYGIKMITGWDIGAIAEEMTEE